MPQTSQIVHESETQRQFVRLKLPASARIEGKHYTVKDLSSAGFSIRDIGAEYKKRKIIDLVLILPFSDFSIDVKLKAEMLHYDKKSNVAGCRFVDLNANQLSILNHVMKAFISGEAVGVNDVINVVARDNFVQLRKHGNDDAPSLKDNLKKYILYGLAVLAILTLTSFIIYSLYERIFILTTPYGQVQANQMEIFSPASGTFASRLPEGSLSVKKGQLIGTLATQTNNGATLGNITKKLKIMSPCDCYIMETPYKNNNHQAENSKLFSLLPRNADIFIQAYVPYENINKLKIGNKATVHVSGTDLPVNAVITDIKTDEDIFLLKETPVALVRMNPEKALPKDLIHRPAFIEFYL